MKSLFIFLIALLILVGQRLFQKADTELCESTRLGYRLTGNLFHKYFGISWKNCIENCKKIRKCASVNFIRASGYCELNDADGSTKSSSLQSERGVMYSSKSNWHYVEPMNCQSCEDSEMCTEDADKPCKVIGCSVLNPVSGSTILGNMYGIGARQVHICRNGERHTVTCQVDGQWSILPIEYLCTIPQIRHATYNVIGNYTTGLTANISCNPGFVRLGVDNIRYNSSSKEWADVSRVECVMVEDGPWTLVYGKLQGFPGEMYSLWQGSSKSDVEFRNDKILDNWTSNAIQKVKIDVQDFSGDIVRTLSFNGSNGDNENWFSYENLVESSWADLKDKTPAVFGIRGIRAYRTESVTALLRWAILDCHDVNGFTTINCTEDRMWFAVTKGKLNPCDNLFGTRGDNDQVIVFSNSTNGTRWHRENFGFAKTMLVYVRS